MNTDASKTSTGFGFKKWLILSLVVIVALIISFFIYLNFAFPESRTKMIQHLEATPLPSEAREQSTERQFDLADRDPACAALG